MTATITKVPSNKGRTFDVEPLSTDEVTALIRACSGRAPTGVRNRALVAVMGRAGLRCGEALALKPRDVDGDMLRVRVGKTGYRVLGLHPEAQALIERWMSVRGGLRGLSRVSPLFCTLRGGELDSSYVRRLMPRLAERAGIDKRVHPHGLRHSFATQLALEGVPAVVLRDALGHSSLSTTDTYLRRIAPATVVAAMRERA